MRDDLTDPFATLKLQNPSRDFPEHHNIRWSIWRSKIAKGPVGEVFYDKWKLIYYPGNQSLPTR